MIYLYAFFALFFVAVLLVMGRYETRRADRKLLDKLADAGVVTRHQNKTTPGRA